jgi:hypothetical protein
MIKNLLFTIGFGILTVGLNAQIRYVDNVIEENQISIDKDIKYASNYTLLYGDQDTAAPGFQPKLEDLLMDIYSPNDGSSNRPLIIYLHTGSFLPRYINNTPTGYKDDSATVAMCMEFAKKGYVVVSMAYRLGWDPRSLDETVRRSTIINAAYKGVQDLSACIRFFKEEASALGNPYGIDTTKIAIGGQGTGSYITNAFAGLDRQDEIKINKFRDPQNGTEFVQDAVWGDRHGYGGLPGYNKVNTPGFKTDAHVSFAIGGALGDTSWMEKGEIPTIWAHSIDDPFAPYTTGMVNVPGTTLQVVEVSGGYDAMKRCQELGNTAVYKGKVMDNYTREINKLNDGIDGLYPIAGIQNSSGPYEWYDTNYIKTLPPQFYDIPAILGGAKLSNPLMSKTRAMKFVDTLQGYLAPRIAVSLGLVDRVGISETNMATNVTIAPNPTKNHIIVHNNWDNNNLKSIKVFSINGQFITALNVTGAHNEFDLNLPNGLYLLSMEFDNGIGTKKLVIE